MMGAFKPSSPSPETMTLVKVSEGMLRGVVCEGIHKYYAFKGIPYAKPPVGDLRFKAPEPPEPWIGVRDAKEHGPVCPQYNERLDRLEEGSEDCLYLNVYTRSLPAPQPLPVMIWIHGGGFYTGSGNSDYYGPDFFLSNDVILVTFNYRLEALGFLCLDIEDAPGNAGLKDQVLALKWVKKNIAEFGGDPNNITIFGCSAGSASVSYHLISKMSEGLFNKAICQSGVCLNDWAYNLHARERAFQLGKLLGKDTEDPKELLEFLKSTPVANLVRVKLPPLVHVIYRDVADSLLFGPVIEKAELKVEKFITEPPPCSLKYNLETKVPVMMGYTSGEGIEISRNLQGLLDHLSTVGAVVPRELKLKWPAEKIEEMDKLIREYYFDDKCIKMESLPEVTNLYTASFFIYNIVRFARWYSGHTTSPVFLYKFDSNLDRGYTKKLYKMDNLEGVCHADEIPYQFHITNLDMPLTESTRSFIEKFTKTWCNFAKTGNPNETTDCEQWKPFSDSDRYCLIINNSGYTCEKNVDGKTIQFWDRVYEENTNSA